MTITIPEWLLWVLGSGFAIAAIFIIGLIVGFAWVGRAMSKALMRGLGW